MVEYGRRGYLLEDLINYTNDLYRADDIAMVQKTPTPITPLKMTGNIITRAFFTKKSTVDYIGVCNGKAICFDAKECHGSSFPLKNIHDHQVLFMRDFEKNGGIAFLILYFVKEDRFYFLSMEELVAFLDREVSGGKKSFRPDELKESGFFKQGTRYPVPYADYIKR